MKKRIIALTVCAILLALALSSCALGNNLPKGGEAYIRFTKECGDFTMFVSSFEYINENTIKAINNESVYYIPANNVVYIQPKK